ncbi:ISCaje4 transposase TnpB [Campylobacter phage CP220]|uniref:ISCaje4 transposase TnpB n=1 Tax=Campylobacter phage CP220 TaxID=2994044 RepID=D5GVD8_9CAUD|nr:ISCaje4 transposase TnpB [Campylobacter phage CP220]CBJ93955.1 ISCaje4 transposase TnpB [Campylobacter phage CP220]
MIKDQENIITIKLDYKSSDTERILDCIKNYNSLFRSTYSFYQQVPDLKQAETTRLQSKLNNIFLDKWFFASAVFDVKSFKNKKKKDEKVIFGGKKNFFDRLKGKISKQEYQLKRLLPLYSVGEASKSGNRKFQIEDENTIIFKVSRKEHITLKLNGTSKRYRDYLNQLITLQINKYIPITYKLDTKYVYISFDLNKLKHNLKVQDKIKDRVFGIDLNPNYIGYSVVDWKNDGSYKIIKTGSISLKALNDYDNSLKGQEYSSQSKERKYISNKRNHEIIQIAHQLPKLANHFGCEIFSLEDLNMKQGAKEKGTKFNKLCNNQWCRNLLVSQIKKMNCLYKIRTLEVQPQYSSFIGNLVYRVHQLPDYVLASIEIGRRGYEFYHQYILKDKKMEKNIIFGNYGKDKNLYNLSLEEIGIKESFNSFMEMYSFIKNSKTRYRVSLDDIDSSRVFRKLFIKSYTEFYNFL